MTYRIKNWEKFQHYKDRSPEWIKLYGELLNDFDWFQLPGDTAKVLVGLWLLAREDETRTGILPPLRDICFRLRLTEEDALGHLGALSHWLEPSDAPSIPDDGLTPAQRLAAKNGFGSRHISNQVRIAVWSRDGGKCRYCGSTDSIEYDHVVPVSRGGNSEEENVQLLCRPCNRKKRAKLPEQAQLSATHAQHLLSDSRSLETETETETEIEADSAANAAADVFVPPDPSVLQQVEAPESRARDYAFSGDVIRLSQKDFDNWKRAYPKLNLLAELTARDAWLATAAERDRGRWFVSTAAHLRNQNAKAAKGSDFKWSSGIEGVY